MADDRLINHTQGAAIIAALETIAGSGLSIRIVPARADGDAVGTIIINGTSAELFSNPHTEQFAKLDGIASGAEVNQNAFSAVAVGGTTIAADSKTDTLTIAAGNNVSLAPDSTNDTITISATDTTYAPAVSGGADGLMTGADKAKLDAMALPSGGASFPVTTDAAPSVSFTSAAAGRPILPVVHIAPQQADGTPSPSNPLPITGRTAANVTLAKMGKNLLNAPGSYSASSQLIIGTIKLSSGRYSLSANVTNIGASVARLRLYDLSGAVRGDLYV